MGIGQMITMPLFFASNALYPVKIMPGWLKVLSRVNPLSLRGRCAARPPRRHAPRICRSTSACCSSRSCSVLSRRRRSSIDWRADPARAHGGGGHAAAAPPTTVARPVARPAVQPKPNHGYAAVELALAREDVVADALAARKSSTPVVHDAALKRLREVRADVAALAKVARPARLTSAQRRSYDAYYESLVQNAGYRLDAAYEQGTARATTWRRRSPRPARASPASAAPTTRCCGRSAARTAAGCGARSARPRGRRGAAAAPRSRCLRLRRGGRTPRWR